MIHLDIKKLGRIEVVGHRITGDRSQRMYEAGWEYPHNYWSMKRASPPSVFCSGPQIGLRGVA